MKLSKFIELFFDLPEVWQMFAVFGVVLVLIYGVYRLITWYYIPWMQKETFKDSDAAYYKAHNIEMPRDLTGKSGIRETPRNS